MLPSPDPGLETGDVIHVSATLEGVEVAAQASVFSLSRRIAMYVVIAGGGRTGHQLANLLISQDHEVRVVDNRREVLERIHRELPTEAIIEGDPLEMHVLEQAGIQRADVMAACTTSDEINLALVLYGAHPVQCSAHDCPGEQPARCLVV